MVRPPGRASQAEQLRVATEKQLRPLREELDAVQAGHGRRSRSRAGRSESLGRIRIYKAEWPAADGFTCPWLLQAGQAELALALQDTARSAGLAGEPSHGRAGHLDTPQYVSLFFIVSPYNI